MQAFILRLYALFWELLFTLIYINVMENVYFSQEETVFISFWCEKRLEKEIRTTFNEELYLKVLKARSNKTVKK